MPTTNLTLTPKGCRAQLTPDSELPELAYAIEIMVSNFIGRAAPRISCNRVRLADGSCLVEITPIDGREAGPMAMSKVGSIGYAVQEGLFPMNLNEKQLFQVEEPGFVSEGQHRHQTFGVFSRRDRGKTTSIVESYDFEPKAPLSLITYGLSDMFTGLFNLGVSYIKWQGSLKRTQLFIQHDLSDEKLHRYLVSNNPDYPIKNTVSTLK